MTPRVSWRLPVDREGLPLAKRTLYLFPDTNVFIQCRSLKEVDWSEWRHYAKIHLIVCQPIQREMDKHKNRGSDRVAKRARKNVFQLSTNHTERDTTTK